MSFGILNIKLNFGDCRLMITVRFICSNYCFVFLLAKLLLRFEKLFFQTSIIREAQLLRNFCPGGVFAGIISKHKEGSCETLTFNKALTFFPKHREGS